MYTDTLEGKIDYIKSSLELLKHLTTVSSAFVVLIPTLMEKVFSSASFTWVAIVSLVIFTFSIAASVYSYVYLLDAMQYQTSEKEHFLHSTPNGINVGYGIISAWISFILGILSFVIYTAINI